MYVQQLVKTFSLHNVATTPTAEDLMQDFETLLYHQEEPFPSTSIFAQYKVYELARQHGVTVLLDGQGADEMLAGYHKYYHWYGQELVAQGKWKKAAEEVAQAKNLGAHISWGIKNYVAAYMPSFTAAQLQQKALKQVKLNRDFTRQFALHYKRDTIDKPVVEKLNDVLYFNTMQGGLEELLRYADRNSMAHSREVRLPFLNHQLVQFIFSLPSHLKIKEGYTKWILRQAMQHNLPANIVWRKDKVGFEPPQQQWMQHPGLLAYTHEAKKKLVAQQILTKDVLNKPVLQQAAHEQGNFDWRYLCAARML